MKRFFIGAAIVLGGAVACKAQDGFRVNGNIEGFPDGPLYLMSYEQGRPDTLGVAQTVNGAFTFTGKVDGVQTAYIMTADKKGSIPLMLENTEFTVNMGSGGLTLKGGEQQNIYNQFLSLSAVMQQQQKKLKEALQDAQKEQNVMKLQVLRQEAVKLMEGMQGKEDELLKKHADSYAAAYKVVSGMQKQDMEVLKARYALLGENARNTSPGRTVATVLAQYDKVAVGQTAPDFKVLTPEGGTVALSEMKGKVKLIDFWASWCAPCRRENPNVVKIYQKYHEDGLEILSVSLDKDNQAWVKAIGEDQLSWQQGIDQGSRVAQQYFVRGIPHTILLDENNTIVAKNLRGAALQKKISEMLEGK